MINILERIAYIEERMYIEIIKLYWQYYCKIMPENPPFFYV